MTWRRAAGVLALAVALASSSGGARAAHCTPVFLLAGSSSVNISGNRVAGVNLGQVGCVIPTQPEFANTNRIPVGVTQVWAGVSQFDGVPSGGSITHGSTSTNLTWTYFPLRLRYESQTVTIPASATSVTVTTTVGSTSHSVTYTRP
jgi:hypothetical protein